MHRLRSNKLPGWQKALFTLLSMVVWVGVWWLIVANTKMPMRALLATPPEAIDALLRLWPTEAFREAVQNTLFRILSGYLCAVVAGSLLAVACYFVRPLDLLLSPLRSVIRCVPVASFIILLWLILDKEQVPSFVSFLMVTPVIWENVQKGFDSASPLLL